MRIKVKWFVEKIKGFATNRHCLTVLVMAVFVGLAIGSASAPKAAPEAAVPIEYKGIPFLELSSAIDAVNSPGQGFIVEGYVVGGALHLEGYDRNNTLNIANSLTSGASSLTIKLHYLSDESKPDFMRTGNPDSNYIIPQPRQFETYTRDELEHRLEKNMKYKIYIGVYGVRIIETGLINDRENVTFSGNNKSAFIDKIEGLASREEMKSKAKVELDRRAIYNNWGAWVMTDWTKAFSNKENAEQWLKDISSRFSDVENIISAREKLYNRDVDTFKFHPSKLTRDNLLKDKNNLIEAYNRYLPIVADVEKITAKGVRFEYTENKVDETILSPFFKGFSPVEKLFRCYSNQNQVKEDIADLNKNYSKLIDTFPVN